MTDQFDTLIISAACYDSTALLWKRWFTVVYLARGGGGTLVSKTKERSLVKCLFSVFINGIYHAAVSVGFYKHYFSIQNFNQIESHCRILNFFRHRREGISGATPISWVIMAGKNG